MSDAKTLVERLFAAIDAQQWEDAAAVLHPDAEVTTPLGDVTTDAWLALNRAFATAIPDVRHSLRVVVPDGNRCAVEGTWTGTHTGPLAMPGGEIPPTGRAVELPFCSFVTCRGYRIAQVSAYFDQLSMFVQLGLAPEPAAA